VWCVKRSAPVKKAVHIKVFHNILDFNHGISMELLKFSDKLFKERLLNFMNKIWKGETPPQSGQKAIVIPIFKKGDMKECHNY
jgi:hypothetical protein